MLIKAGVEMEKFTLPALIGVLVCQSVYIRLGYTFTITSITDGKHKANSKHYEGNAFDLRIWGVPQDELLELVNELEKKLGQDYDVVLEGDHIHVEFDPD